jgi:hypothetical protein
MVVLLALLAAMIASFFAGPRAVGIAFVATLLSLGFVKFVEGRATRRR